MTGSRPDGSLAGRAPHAGPVLHSPEQLPARLRARESTEPPPPPGQPCRIYDPIIAEIHRTRAQLSREREASGLILKDEPPPSKT